MNAILFEEREAKPFVKNSLHQWPIRLKLVPEQAPYFQNCHLLVAADCSAFSYPGFLTAFCSGRTMVIGCPKLDSVDYSQKLCNIINGNDVQSVTVVRMEVPCCGGLVRAVETAISQSRKDIPLHVTTITLDGERK